MADIITLGGNFKNIKEITSYCNAQFVALQSAVEQIKKLEGEIKHLQQVLTSTTALLDPKTGIIIKTPELAICEAQIELLQNRALQKELTLEEIKMLDLLIINKRLLSGDPTTIEGQKAKPKKQYSEAQLILIAKKDDKNGSN